MDVWVFTIITVLCLALEGFFSGSEISLVAVDKQKLRQKAALGHRGAKIAERFIGNPPLLFSVTLLGQNFFIVANTVLATFFIIQRWGTEYEFLALLLSPLVLIFGEVVPKSFFQQHANRWASKISPFLLAFCYITYPLVSVLSRLTHLMLGGVKNRSILQPAITKEGLELMLSDRENQANIKPGVRETIRKILNITETRVYEIMTPLVEADCVRSTTRIREVYEIFRDNGFSRMPVFKDRVTKMIGVLNIFDVLHAEDPEAFVTTMMKPPLYVPDLMVVDELFKLLKSNKKNIAFVVDEYGGVVGIVTIEDILEEIVGEIEDEYDDSRELWIKNGEKEYVFDARTTINEINSKLKWNLPHGEYETLAGFVIDQVGGLPEIGESFRFQKLTFIVKKAALHSIEEVVVSLD
ncbi:MAG: hypothetical protein A3B79_03475 [Deltaproteobacteria bacterium RIFCSPHIGHO2_02_FULL_50_15]|nr:MAG: hypothetical protein A3B79_03475 [Deltaproteobacteria bacterium RIFCSPHIGHO2_02_FULL_50_15]